MADASHESQCRRQFEYTRRVRSPRRIAMLLLDYALLGAVTTVAVAWGIALRGFAVELALRQRTETKAAVTQIDDQTFAVVVSTPRSGRGWAILHTSIWPLIRSSQTEVVARIPTQSITDRISYPILSRIPRNRHLPSTRPTDRGEYWFGWPVRSLWCARDVMYNDRGAIQTAWKHLITIRGKPSYSNNPFIQSPFNRRPLAVPTGTLAHGFAINTAFYAGTWWVLLVGISRVRAWNRRRRGLCVKCTYDLRGIEPHAPCPECGKARVPS